MGKQKSMNSVKNFGILVGHQVTESPMPQWKLPVLPPMLFTKIPQTFSPLIINKMLWHFLWTTQGAKENFAALFQRKKKRLWDSCIFDWVNWPYLTHKPTRSLPIMEVQFIHSVNVYCVSVMCQGLFWTFICEHHRSENLCETGKKSCC